VGALFTGVPLLLRLGLVGLALWLVSGIVLNSTFVNKAPTSAGLPEVAFLQFTTRPKSTQVEPFRRVVYIIKRHFCTKKISY